MNCKLYLDEISTVPGKPYVLISGPIFHSPDEPEAGIPFTVFPPGRFGPVAVPSEWLATLKLALGSNSNPLRITIEPPRLEPEK